ncbi:MAG: amidohydrolase [Syntrophales bacterium]|nr:amidohydrolase [Syntrophales bacterium]
MAKNNSSKKISRRKFLKISALATAGVFTGFPTIQASTPTAELILINGKIITVDVKGSIMEGVAVRGGKIIDTGIAEKISKYIGTQTKVIDLKGKTVTPGLIDSHAHLPPFGLRESGAWVKLQGMETKEEILEALAQRARITPAGTFINAWGVESLSLSFMDKRDLDKVTSRHPLLVVHTGGQWGFANTQALNAAGIDKNTVSPPGSRVQKGNDGEPTGLLVHYPALYLVRKHMPIMSDEDARASIRHAAELYVKEGVTTIHDNFLMVAEIGSTKFIKAYIDLVQTKTLPTRIKLWPYLPNLKEATLVMEDLFSGKDPMTDSPVRELSVLRKHLPELFAEMWGGLKIAIDGGGQTSLWYDNQRALPLHSTADLKAMVALFHRADQQVSVHAIGDKAVDLFLDSVEAAQKDHRRNDARHRIEHALLPRSGSLERIKRLGVVISTHPQWIFHWGNNFRMKNRAVAIPLNSYLKGGIPVAFGADPPAFPLYQPQIALWQAIKRTTKGGSRFDSSESISIQEALKMQTMGSAYSGFQEREIGSIETGKLADMVVWDRDYYSVSKDEIKDVKAVMTFVGGKSVYEKRGS